MKFYICFFIFLFNFGFTYADLPIPQPTKNYIMVSIPKSGTHLIEKLLSCLSSNKSPFLGTEFFFEDAAVFPPHKYATHENFFRLFPPETNFSLRGHFNFSYLFRLFAEQHPENPKFVLIRDLRDVCVSTTYFIKDYLDAVLGPNSSFDSRLLYVIQGTAPVMNISVFNIQKEANGAWNGCPILV